MDEFETRLYHLKNRIYSEWQQYEEAYSKRYAFTSANLNYFLPELRTEKHKSFYKNCLYNQHLSSLEENNIKTIDSINIINDTSFINIGSLQQSQSPIIFTTFHLGSYRILNSFLTKKGFNSTLIVDEDVYTSQKDSFLNSWEHVEDYYKKNSSFSVLNAEKRSVILTLMRQINKNNVLIVYLDGNTGTGKKLSENKNLTTINFLGKEIFVRKGFAFLANILKANVIPVLSYRNDDKINLHFFNEISYDSTISREASITEVVDNNFKNFEKYLLKYPEQWEGWFYMHKWFNLNSLRKAPYISLSKIIEETNFERYVPFKYCVNEYFLFDKSNYTSYPISFKLFKNLWNNSIGNINEKDRSELIKINAII